ncbi:bactofilin family protein [Paenibacillus puerhi]|uniref:bactofilin family protein n=1 Tax=Paenibacillus puerhi TaxID=2692622 RepID=UPI00135BB871|nr:polymer-forming cytoskeletal protein [Paenibacillus puerhi]
MIGLWNQNRLRARATRTVTLIGEGCRIQGNLTSEADLRIEGEFVGTIHAAGEVAIGERGIVRCRKLEAADVVVAGTLEGSVQAEGIVRITPTGRLEGRLAAGTLIIEQGAVFEGHSMMAVDRLPVDPQANEGPDRHSLGEGEMIAPTGEASPAALLAGSPSPSSLLKEL